MGKGEQIERLKTMGMRKRKDDEGENSEEVCQKYLCAGRETWRERRECCYDDIKGRCVIWCGKFSYGI